MYQWMHDRNELEFLVEMLKTSIGDAEDTEKKGKNNRSKAKSEDAMAAEVVENLILKQNTESTRITSNRKHCPNTVDSPNLVCYLFQGTKQQVVDAVVEILVDEDDMKAEEAIIIKYIIIKSITLRQLDHHNIQRYYLLVTRATKLVQNCRLQSRRQRQ